LKIPEGDNRQRYCCDNCNEIIYQNPKIVAGCIAHFERKILLCKRAIEPRKNFWTIPAGFLENGESIENGAIRETSEEANLKVKKLKLFQIYSIPRINQIYIIFLKKIRKVDSFSAGDETYDVRLFSFNEIPWDKLAFQTVSKSLKKFIKDYPNNTNVYNDVLE
jgi:ADP-ribose pyrophosphatase YjhB (NUDIX family)